MFDNKFRNLIRGGKKDNFHPYDSACLVKSSLRDVRLILTSMSRQSDYLLLDIFHFSYHPCMSIYHEIGVHVVYVIIKVLYFF